MEYPQFLQSSQSILQENMVNIRFSANTAFSFPVVARRGNMLCDAMFCYKTPGEGRSLTAQRPHGWVLLSRETGETVLSASCDTLDFVDTQAHPLDEKVEMRLPQPLSARDHSRCYQLIFEEYEKLRAFAFAEQPDIGQQAAMESYRNLFRGLAYVGHYPYYYGLSPEFFAWLGLDLGVTPTAAQPENAAPQEQHLTAQALADELAMLAEELRSHIEAAMRDMRAHLQREDKLQPQQLAAFAGEMRERLADSTRKDNIIDKLHAELQDYKNGLLDNLTLSLERDIIKVMDDIRKGADAFEGKNFTKENYRKVFHLLQGVEQDLQDLLYRHGVESYEVPGNTVDVQRQRIVSTVPTADPALDKKLARRVAPGWEKQSGVVRPERINVYVLTQEQTDTI